MAAGLGVEHLAIPDVLVLTCPRHGDDRGFFSETYNRNRFAEAGIAMEFVQDNHSLSAEPGTVRGLHFQTPPFAQDKLVRVVRGAILDVAVDLRTGSPTYGQHVSAVISAKAWNQILVPIGFAHGFVTLEPDTEVVYKVSNVYSPEHDKGLLWNDPALGIDWGVSEAAAILSAKDKVQPRLADLPAYFSSDKDQSR
ncbi:dTDP-4-dehydrorhamnose 3,5-epimerase [Jiella sp. M17.18]|uniref:dTDP-4-dehydrorhamnose 3,5-epimerase n=1 Tax=Jiella sp. M17.18 TaxID=3234247 RepID=UPI0034DE2E02